MRKYWQFIKMSFQELAEYRLNLLWEIGGISIRNIFIYLFWVTALSSGISSSGYTANSLGLYYLLIILVGQFADFGHWDVANSIHHDFISAELSKPYSFAFKSFCISMASKTVKVAVSLGILILILFVFKFEISLAKSILFIFSMLLATASRFFIGMSIGILAFWFKRVIGFNALFWNLGGLFSGELIPVDLLPLSMKVISQYLPFPYLTYFPVSIIVKTLDNSAILLGLLLQFFWIIVFATIYNLLWRKGVKRLETSGG